MKSNQHLNRAGAALVTALMGASLLGACTQQDPFKVPYVPAKKEKVSDKAAKISFNPKVDILFVVDDSGSMAQKQANVIANAQQFIAEFQKNKFLDYHLGVVTSSMNYPGGKGGDGKLVGSQGVLFIDRNTPKGLSIFQDSINCGTSGNSTEMFFDPVFYGLTPPLVNGYNAGFLRDDAHLATIFLTDANDQSDHVTSAGQFYSFLVDGLKHGDSKMVHPYAVFIPSADRSCERSGEDSPLLIEELLRISAGLSFDLCDPNFGTKLAGIGADLAQKVGKTIYLTRPPDPKTIQVSYGTQVIPSDVNVGWSFDPSQNAILLGDGIKWSTQPDGTTLQVDFIAAEYN